MQKYTDLDSIRDRIEELQNEINEKTQAAEGARDSGQEFCETDSEDGSDNCSLDCTDCAEAYATDIESEREDLESEQTELQTFVSDTKNYFKPVVDHLLSENNGDFSVVTNWLETNDFAVYEDWESYARSYVENNFDSLEPIIANNIDYEAIASELSTCETWEEIAGYVIIFY